MLVLTNQTIGNAERTITGFPFEGTVFEIDTEDEGLYIKAKTMTMDEYILRGIPSVEEAAVELRRLADAYKSGAAYDDKNVYEQLK
jgi:hypothetical protein